MSDSEAAGQGSNSRGKAGREVHDSGQKDKVLDEANNSNALEMVTGANKLDS